MPAVLITGASTGIGRAAALWMARDGWTVFAGVRKQADADSLTAEGAATLKPVLIDVTNPEQVRAAVAQLDAALPDGLDGLVNNAGIGGGGPLETLDPEAIDKVFQVNVYGIVRCTSAFLPLLRRGSPGRVVNISSIGGRWAGPFLGPYHMSKWAVEAYSDSLRMELHPHGIEVSVVEPGTISTAIWEKAEDQISGLLEDLDERGEQHYGDDLRTYAKVVANQPNQGVHPDVVAKTIHHALTAGRPRTRYLVGPDAKLIARLRWLLPDRWFDALIRRAVFRRKG